MKTVKRAGFRSPSEEDAGRRLGAEWETAWRHPVSKRQWIMDYIVFLLFPFGSFCQPALEIMFPALNVSYIKPKFLGVTNKYTSNWRLKLFKT